MSIVAAVVVPHPPLILPEVGHGEEKGIQRTIDAYRTVMERAAALKPDTVVVTSPHSIMYADYFHISPGRGAKGNFAQFRAPQVEVQVDYDEEFVKALAQRCQESFLAAGTLGEKNPALDHGSLIPLRFLQEHSLDFKVVRIGLSGLPARDHYALGQHIEEVSESLGRRVLLIASGDLSHKLKEDGPYGFAEEGPKFDKLTMQALGSGDFLSLLEMDPDLAEGAAECGLRSFWIMAGAMDCKGVKTEALSYEGPFGVGYGVVWVQSVGSDASRNLGAQLEDRHRKRMEERKAGEDALVRLARLSLETFVRTRGYAKLPENLPKELTDRKAGAFVSLKKDGRLRGCIGTILPTQSSLAEEILQNAVSAGLHDTRFSPVQPSELPELVYSVDVLGEPEPIDSPKELDVHRYGVIVQCGNRRGLLLPDLAGVDTIEQQIDIARKKGNIRPDEKVQLWRFEVVRHH
ncbi:MAG: AmmeMemoRadiSam system protein A [Selenomonadaceae bacterium]|nr:AmmeMemoRadiSam system protein A [Selenomonadaceae bacterium]